MKEIIFGAIQGLTEFIPVSSSAHLQWFGHFFSTTDIFLFTLVVHLGTWFSILLFYRLTLIHICKHMFKPSPQNIFLKIVVTSIPASIAGILIVILADRLFEELHWSAFGFILTAVFLLGTKRFTSKVPSVKSNPDAQIKELETVSFKQAVVIGFVQALALCPGISRSGWTSATGIYMGLRPSTALHFSFIQGFVIVLGACIVEFITTTWAQVEMLPLALGFVSSFVFGLIALKLMQAWVWKLYSFSFYLLIIGVSGLLYLSFVQQG